jgi:hypothetical protein
MEKKGRQFKVGDRVKVSLPVGQIVDATIRAVIESTEGIMLQVDFGHDQTALVHERDVLSE